MTARAINQKIMQRCELLKSSEFFRSPVAGDRALGVLLDVSHITIGKWRREGLIPFTNFQGSSINIYKLNKVIEALEEHNAAINKNYLERMESAEKGIALLELQERVNSYLDQLMSQRNEPGK
jgi:hypothetical protein